MVSTHQRSYRVHSICMQHGRFPVLHPHDTSIFLNPCGCVLLIFTAPEPGFLAQGSPPPPLRDPTNVRSCSGRRGLAKGGQRDAITSYVTLDWSDTEHMCHKSGFFHLQGV